MCRDEDTPLEEKVKSRPHYVNLHDPTVLWPIRAWLGAFGVLLSLQATAVQVGEDQ